MTKKSAGGRTKVYCTRYSQAVTHPGTNRARRCLTSVIGREPVPVCSEVHRVGDVLSPVKVKLMLKIRQREGLLSAV